jgi:hypothetical protein
VLAPVTVVTVVVTDRFDSNVDFMTRGLIQKHEQGALSGQRQSVVTTITRFGRRCLRGTPKFAGKAMERA